MRRLLRPPSSSRRFAGEIALLVLLNLLLAALLWRELRPASTAFAPLPLTPPALPLVTSTFPPTEPPPSPLPSATMPLPASTSTPTPLPSLSPSPIVALTLPPPTAASTETAPAPTQPITGIVRAIDGVNLRDGPGGAVVTQLADGTAVTFLAGRQEAGNYTWQEVRTPAGVEGWIAADLLEVAP